MSAARVPIAHALAAATGLLTDAGVPSARVDARALLAHVLGVEPGEVERRRVLGRAVTPGELAAFDALVAERADRRPLQHLTGEAAFRTVTVQVGPGVFVPRPETECAVGHVLAELARLGANPLVVDLCTGSGAIACAVAVEGGPDVAVHAVELSAQAHAWARRTIDALALRGGAGAIDLRLGDATDPATLAELDGRVDVVVTNPPYIPPGAVPIDPEVRDHDPPEALYGGGDDGLAVPLAVADRAYTLLRPGGLLVLEHADVQSAAITAALTLRGWDDVEVRRDLTDRPRHALARRPRLLYHLAEAPVWEAALEAGEYRASTLRRTLDQDGFIHLSRAEQWPVVRSRFFTGYAGRLVLLTIDPLRVGAPVVTEVGDPVTGERFPHLYGPLPVRAVVAVTDLD